MKQKTYKNKIKKTKNITIKNRKTKNKTRKKKQCVFSEKDFCSGDGFLSSVWGPAMWHFLHIMSFNYPVNPSIEDKYYYREFVLNLKYTLPCKYCRINLKTNFKQLPLTISVMKNRDSFSRYIYQLHELINKMLQKKSNLSFNDVRERYEHFRSRCTDERPKLFTLSKSHTRKNKTKEKGCTEPLYGKKSKCVINIVPQEENTPTFKIDKKCIKYK
jgi:hypothetical protein